MSGTGAGASGGPPTAPPAITVPLANQAPNVSGGGGVYGGGGGGGLNGGGGGRVVQTVNPLVGHVWFGLIGATAVGITFHANNSFTLVDTTPTGQIITIQGSSTATPSSTTGIGGVAQTQITNTLSTPAR